MSIHRRFAAGLLVTGLLASACGSDTENGADGQRSGDGVFPLTIEHKYGSTEVPAEPTRVVSIGYQEHDFIFALGVTPVAVRYWHGDEDDVIFPWAEEAAGDADPEILIEPELNFEQIASLRPDLILGVYSGISDTDYETLSEIAPTITQTDEYLDYGVPWQVTTVTIGRALGREQLAEDLVAEVEGQFKTIRDDHPEFVGMSLAVVAGSPQDEGGMGFFASQDPRSRFWRLLGFEVPAALDDIAGELFYGSVSREQLDVFETDVLLWDQLQYVEGGRDTVVADPLVAQLSVVSEGRTIFLDGDLENAFGWQSILSIPYVLENILPMLEAATDGDATT